MKTPNIPTTNKVQTLIVTTLIDGGVPTNLLGYGYLRTALELVLAEPSYLHKITSLLYPKIAKEHDTTASRVERSIRHAIESTMDRMDIDFLKDHLGLHPSISTGKVTNSEFISSVAEKLRVKLGVYA